MFYNLLTKGHSLNPRKTAAQRFYCWLGRRLAMMGKEVRIPPSCTISPEARIHPRGGRIELGENCTIGLGAFVQGMVTLGNDCSVQAYSIIVAYGSREEPGGEVRIGNGVRIAPQCMLIGANHNIGADLPIHRQGLSHKSIIIEDDVWLAGNVKVTAGVTIGKGAVVGAGAVVTKDIPPMAVAVGVPARVIHYRE